MMETKNLINATCPECRGPMSENRMNGMKEFRCLVGHAYSPRTLLQAHGQAQEGALWAAVVALEEAANLVDAAADQLPAELVSKLRRQAEKKGQQAQQLRGIIQELEPFATD